MKNKKLGGDNVATKTKSVFLYRKPTKTKRLQIMEIESLYREHINFFIEKLLADEKYYLAILNNNKKSPLIRELDLALIEELLLKAEDKELIAFYQEIIALFNKYTDNEIKVIMETVKAMFIEQIEKCLI